MQVEMSSIRPGNCLCNRRHLRAAMAGVRPWVEGREETAIAGQQWLLRYQDQ